LLAVLIVDVTYVAVIDYIRKDLNLSILGLQTDPQFLLLLGGVMLGVGTLIGAVGSGISMRKFLRV